MHVLFVCYANICRSFMAQELLKQRLPGLSVRSRGLYADPACRVPEKVTHFLEQNALSAPDHRAAPLTEADLQWADYVFFMEQAHLDQTADRWAQYSESFFLLLDYAFDMEKDIADPISLSGKAFTKEAQKLKEAVFAAADKLSFSR